jgi:late competence protein required for DNA uptake (superfamily II DNA/RNA helicase)
MNHRWNTKEEIINLYKNLTNKPNHEILWIEVSNIKTTKMKCRCKRCGSEFEVTGHNYIRAGGTKTPKNFIESENKHFFPYYCTGCLSLFRRKCVQNQTGEAHWNWQVGISGERDANYDSYEYKKWRERPGKKHAWEEKMGGKNGVKTGLL